MSSSKSAYELPLTRGPNIYSHKQDVHAYGRQITSKGKYLNLENQHCRALELYANFVFLQKPDLWVTYTRSQWGKRKWLSIASTALFVSKRFYRKWPRGAAQTALPGRCLWRALIPTAFRKRTSKETACSHGDPLIIGRALTFISPTYSSLEHLLLIWPHTTLTWAEGHSIIISLLQPDFYSLFLSCIDFLLYHAGSFRKRVFLWWYCFVHVCTWLSFLPFSFFNCHHTVLAKSSTGKSRFCRNYSNISIFNIAFSKKCISLLISHSLTSLFLSP